MSLPIDDLLARLAGLPAPALYGSAFGAAFIENLFPPFPSDVIIGLAAFAAAQGSAVFAVAFALVMLGNVGGAGLTYMVGRRYGATGLRARLVAKGLVGREQKLETLYGRYGLLGLFLGRLIPGVRGLVPLLAGASEISAARTLVVVAIAAAAWYGLLMGLAYHVGSSLEAYLQLIGRLGRIGGVGGAVLVLTLAGVGVWAWRRYRKR
jgi:membrane protein DedA with SNARE-associated domain